MTNTSVYTIFPYKNSFIRMDQLSRGKIVYRDYFIDLVTHEKVTSSWLNWFEEYNFKLGTYFTKPKLVHLFYELGYLIENISNDSFKDSILAIDLEYSSYDKIKLPKKSEVRFSNISSPTFSSYQEKFNLGYEELRKGNCYQFNLTEEYVFSLNDEISPIEIISKIWQKKSSRGAFGSATFIPMINCLFFSNSPECLFQLSENLLTSMPIKGTQKFDKNTSFEEAWKQLQSDKKCESELFMIADLIRNDLSRIEKPCAQVKYKKAPLIVPGILHQYSEINVELGPNVFLKTIIEKMFPGGSITGAPKKRVMKILNMLENRPRGFYCGSTLICFKEMKSASINIRSAVFNFDSKKFYYSAGGGITLRSNVESEYKEMSYKLESFTSLLTP